LSFKNKKMKKLKIIAGISWAFLGLIVIIVLFPGLNSLSGSVAKLPFMKINPNYTGGEVARRLISEKCTLDIREPVFDGLFGERRKGFVQLDWRGDLSGIIEDTIDYDFDTITDFTISIDTKSSKTLLNPLNSKVDGLSISTPASHGWAVRVEIKKHTQVMWP